MKLVILVAGIGSRLRPLTEDRPKCLVEVGGVSILERLLIQAQATGHFEEAILITGYRADAIQSFAETWSGRDQKQLPLQLVHNYRYEETNNGYSLWCAREYLEGGFYLIDGDVVLDEEVWTRLTRSTESTLAVDMKTMLDEEAMKFIRDDAGHVVALSKEISLADSEGESIGFCRIEAEDVADIVRKLEDHIHAGHENEYYERAFQDKLAEGWPLKVVDVGDLTWVEIDEHSDLERASAQFVSNI